jgi:hypothetical protein
LEQAGGVFDLGDEEGDDAVWEGGVRGESVTVESAPVEGGGIAGWGGGQGSGRRPAGSRGKGGALLLRQSKRVGQKRDGILTRPSARTALQRADGVGAQPGACRQLLLGEASRRAVVPQQVSEGHGRRRCQGWPVGHGGPPVGERQGRQAYGNDDKVATF